MLGREKGRKGGYTQGRKEGFAWMDGMDAWMDGCFYVIHSGATIKVTIDQSSRDSLLYTAKGRRTI
jgi:hypothetical protein